MLKADSATETTTETDVNITLIINNYVYYAKAR